MSFYTDVLKKDPRYKSVQTITDINLLDPPFRAKVTALLAEAKAEGHDLRIMETYRSQAKQAWECDHGYSRLRNVGCHGYGQACDFGVYVNGAYEDVGDPAYKFLLPLARKHGLISGQDWGLPDRTHTFIDWGHVQGIPIFRQGEMFRGEWYPGPGYDPWADMLAHGVH